MHPIVRNILVSVVTGALISSIATTASVIITSREHSVKIENLHEQMRQCMARCDRMDQAIYRPSWE